ncbi:uncharacterized protein LOC119568489 isoform X2 [Penaeus monodon]|uniref:uncharacterized protein LOC119568489 isoform X2 n=1 Tax=Penaeus monodon TaxID=6687 RepID=UPI0018A721F7|nr:uncharacterized protein LOC119568489 isoform X2 [Penaeus monodon]
MKILLQMATLSSCFALWLVVAQKFVLQGTTGPCLKRSVEIGVGSLTLCSVYCSVRGCLAFEFQADVCRIYHEGFLESNTGMKNLYQAFTGLANIASEKIVAASPQYSTKVGGLANDCNINTIYHSDYNQPYAWWNVDLGKPAFIHVIRVYPDYSKELYMTRFHDVEVSIGSVAAVGGDALSYAVIGTYIGPFPNSSCCSVQFSLDPPVLARYVHVRRTTAFDVQQDYLIMKEVEIMSPGFQ